MDFIDKIERTMEELKNDTKAMGIAVESIVMEEMDSDRKVYQSQINIIEEELNKVGSSMYEDKYNELQGDVK